MNTRNRYEGVPISLEHQISAVNHQIAKMVRVDLQQARNGKEFKEAELQIARMRAALETLRGVRKDG
jgi:hypothetical protein